MRTDRFPRYGNAASADRLRRARIGAMHASAARAAKAFGWRVGTYVAHEHATRAAGSKELEAYARAFDVPPAWLIHGEIPFRPLGFDEAAVKASERLRIIATADMRDILPGLAVLDGANDRATPAQRLRTAREMAGFATKADAVRYFSWKSTTYVAHESGQNGLSKTAAETYGRAYGVSPAWLVGGGEVSGLPVTEEWPEAAWSAAPQLVARARRPDPVTSRRGPSGYPTTDGGFRPASDAVPNRDGDPGAGPAQLWGVARMGTPGAWPIPCGSVPPSDAPVDAFAVVRVADVDPGDATIQAGDYVLLDRRSAEFSGTGTFAFVRDGCVVSARVPAGTVPAGDRIGRVVAIAWRVVPPT